MNLNPGTVIARIATAALNLTLKGVPLTKEAIAVEAWTLYPRSFTMHGFPYLDSNRVYSKLGTLVAGGVLALVESQGYRVARRTGIPWPVQANLLDEDTFRPQDAPQPPQIERPAPQLSQTPQRAPRNPAPKLTAAPTQAPQEPPAPTAAPQPIAPAPAPYTPQPAQLSADYGDRLPTIPAAPLRAARPLREEPRPTRVPTVTLTAVELERMRWMEKLPIVQEHLRGARAPHRGDALAIWNIPPRANLTADQCRARITETRELLQRAVAAIGPTTPAASVTARYTLFSLERSVSMSFGEEFKESSAA